MRLFRSFGSVAERVTNSSLFPRVNYVQKRFGATSDDFLFFFVFDFNAISSISYEYKTIFTARQNLLRNFSFSKHIFLSEQFTKTNKNACLMKSFSFLSAIPIVINFTTSSFTATTSELLLVMRIRIPLRTVGKRTLFTVRFDVEMKPSNSFIYPKSTPTRYNNNTRIITDKK